MTSGGAFVILFGGDPEDPFTVVNVVVQGDKEHMLIVAAKVRDALPMDRYAALAQVNGWKTDVAGPGPLLATATFTWTTKWTWRRG